MFNKKIRNIYREHKGYNPSKAVINAPWGYLIPKSPTGPLELKIGAGTPKEES